MDENDDDELPSSGEIDNILGILDLPLENVAGDDNDWIAGNGQDLGPIPDDAFMGFPTDTGNQSVNRAPSRNRNALIIIESEQKEEVDCVDTVHRNGPLQTVISPEARPVQTPSPISVLESSGASSGRSLPIGHEVVIPVRTRSKRGQPSNVNPWVQGPPIACAEASSSDSIKGKQKPRMSTQNDGETRMCTHCDVTVTPQWREGPEGKNTLCNACGVRYRSGRLLPEYRPAASPTFSPSVHSNSHRRVLEMRQKATEQAVSVDNPMSTVVESVPMDSNQLDDDPIDSNQLDDDPMDSNELDDSTSQK